MTVPGASGEPAVFCHPSDDGGRADADDSVTAQGNLFISLLRGDKKQAFALIDVWQDDCLHQGAGLYSGVCLSHRLRAEPAGCWLTTESTQEDMRVHEDVLGSGIKDGVLGAFKTGVMAATPLGSDCSHSCR